MKVVGKKVLNCSDGVEMLKCTCDTLYSSLLTTKRSKMKAWSTLMHAARKTLRTQLTIPETRLVQYLIEQCKRY